jgi:hypothetical protein
VRDGDPWPRIRLHKPASLHGDMIGNAVLLDVSVPLHSRERGTLPITPLAGWEWGGRRAALKGGLAAHCSHGQSQETQDGQRAHNLTVRGPARCCKGWP